MRLKFSGDCHLFSRNYYLSLILLSKQLHNQVLEVAILLWYRCFYLLYGVKVSCVGDKLLQLQGLLVNVFELEARFRIGRVLESGILREEFNNINRTIVTHCDKIGIIFWNPHIHDCLVLGFFLNSKIKLDIVHSNLRGVFQIVQITIYWNILLR